MVFTKKTMASLVLTLITTAPFRSATAQTNIRLSPIAALIGVLNMDVDFKISESATLGPTIQYLDRELGGFDAKAFGVGIRSNIYFNGKVFSDGWYVGPLVQYVDVEVREKDSINSTEASASGVGVAAIFGYQWMWDNFNINLGAGPGYSFIEKIELTNNQGQKEEYDELSGFNLAAEFTLGWKF